MISFSFIEVDSFNFDKQIFSNWITEVVLNEGRVVGDIQYFFSSDAEILRINQEFLNHDTFTDIISFPTSTNDSVISGEIFISIERIKENSQDFAVDFINELSRVIIHGILHFLGYEDHSDEEKTLMRSKEDYYLNLHPLL